MSKANSESGIDVHLRYVRISDQDIFALREIRPLVEANSEAFLGRFYSHLKSFEGTRAFLTDETVVRRLLAAQRAYLLSLFDAKFDEAYYQHRRVIGQTHFRIGLDFQWYIGAYVLYLDFLMPLARSHYGENGARIDAIQSAIHKATLLDMSIVLEAYHEGDKAALEASKAQVLHQEKLAAIGLLASGLAHEIGNPLASIQAICDNQLRKDIDPQVAAKFQRIREQVVRITTIVRQLVNYARPSAPNWQPVKVPEVIESSLAIARLSRSAKRIEVKFEFAETVPQLIANRDQLSQVFLNLFLNAIDAMESQAGVLTIRAVSPRSDCVLIDISDNGVGIPPENMKNLFTPFFTTKEVGKGTGLGLHVSEGIIRRHGGKISVRSEAGSGTVFTIELPVRDTPPDEEPHS